MMDIRNYALPGALEPAVLLLDGGIDKHRKGRSLPLKVHYPLGDGVHPVVLISHGAGGNVDTHFAQARHLASHGYVVVCLEHPFSNTATLERTFRKLRAIDDMIHDRREVYARVADVSFVIDLVAEWNRSHQVLKKRLDIRHIAIMGHSFGACTAMMTCGVRASTKWLRPVKSDDGATGSDVRDKRVTCGVALSPQGPGDPFFSDGSYATLAVPLLGISGTNDEVQNGLPPTSRLDAFTKWPDGAHHFVWLGKARHIDFTDATGSGVRMLPSVTRQAAQPIVLASILIFLNEHLRPASDNGDRLSVSLLRRYLTGGIDRVTVLSKPPSKVRKA
ncbi:MAG: alpha/beta hydrolase family protein [Armatimonadota bacterium]